MSQADDIKFPLNFMAFVVDNFSELASVKLLSFIISAWIDELFVFSISLVVLIDVFEISIDPSVDPSVDSSVATFVRSFSVVVVCLNSNSLFIVLINGKEPSSHDSPVLSSKSSDEIIAPPNFCSFI